LVSHAPGAIWSVCNKGLLIHKGVSTGIVSVEDACREYDHVNMQSRTSSSGPKGATEDLPAEYGGARGGTGDAVVTSIELLNESRKPISEIEYGKSFVLRHHIEVKKSLPEMIFRVQVDSEINKSIVIIDSYESHGQFYSLEPGKHVLDIEVEQPNLRPGVYNFSPSLVLKGIGVHLFFQYDMASLMIRHATDRFFYADFRASTYLDSQFRLSKTSNDI
jgi:lipopolysaccharide transport system ATP-binding protein